MPSSKKTLHFLTSALATSAGVSVLGYGMSAQWSFSEMECSAKDTDNYNGTANVQFGLFKCGLAKKSCPSFDNDNNFEVLTLLLSVGGTPFILHAIIISLLALTLLSSAGSLLITLYNSVSNPYETYMGPLGLYVCSSVSGILSFLTLVLFLINTLVVGVPQELVRNNVAVNLRDINTELQVGFYLLIPFMATSVIAILSVFMYEHTAYTQRKEQQRPTEDAPKDIMLY
ncbi:clarin-3 [Anguilla rostrata]|uniref:clarin-3 n=1 Tax=Anguilla rostrata TaxID=7938 RepID=UPI0030D5CFC9